MRNKYDTSKFCKIEYFPLTTEKLLYIFKDEVSAQDDKIKFCDYEKCKIITPKNKEIREKPNKYHKH